MSKAPPKSGPKGKFFRDLFTGPDGATYHLGKVLSIPLVILGMAIPIYAMAMGQTIVMTDVGILLGGIAAAFVMMCRMAKNMDTPGEDALASRFLPPVPRTQHQGDYPYGQSPYPQEDPCPRCGGDLRS